MPVCRPYEYMHIHARQTSVCVREQREQCSTANRASWLCVNCNPIRCMRRSASQCALTRVRMISTCIESAEFEREGHVCVRSEQSRPPAEPRLSSSSCTGAATRCNTALSTSGRGVTDVQLASLQRLGSRCSCWNTRLPVGNVLWTAENSQYF